MQKIHEICSFSSCFQFLPLVLTGSQCFILWNHFWAFSFSMQSDIQPSWTFNLGHLFLLSSQSTKYTACLCTQYCLEIKKPKIADKLMGKIKTNKLKRPRGYNFTMIWKTSRVFKRTSRDLWELIAGNQRWPRPRSRPLTAYSAR